MMIISRSHDIAQLLADDTAFRERYTSLADKVSEAESKMLVVKTNFEDAKAKNKMGDAANKILDNGPSYQHFQ